MFTSLHCMFCEGEGIPFGSVRVSSRSFREKIVIRRFDVTAGVVGSSWQQPDFARFGRVSFSEDFAVPAFAKHDESAVTVRALPGIKVSVIAEVARCAEDTLGSVTF